MNPQFSGTVSQYLLRMLARGLPQDESVLHYMRSTHGGAAPEAFQEVLRDRSTPEAATLAELILFPGEEITTELETLLDGAGLSPEDVLALSILVDSRCPGTSALLPGGEAVPFSLEPGDVSLLVSRLCLDRALPGFLNDAVDARFAIGQRAPIKMALRHCRLDWTPDRTAFLVSLVASLPKDNREREVLEWALGYLGGLPNGAAPLDSLGRAHAELTTRLKQALYFHALLAKSSFEVLMSQGVRAPLLHPESFRRELAMLNAVCLAVTGRPAWALAGMWEMDMGTIEDCESLIAALGCLDG